MVITIGGSGCMVIAIRGSGYMVITVRGFDMIITGFLLNLVRAYH